jgi:hypothetical protein
VKPWDRTIQDRWDDFERFFETDWEGDTPGPRLVEAVEALVDDWWSVAADTVAEEMTRRPRLRRAVQAAVFGDSVPTEISGRLYRLAEQ